MTYLQWCLEVVGTEDAQRRRVVGSLSGKVSRLRYLALLVEGLNTKKERAVVLRLASAWIGNGATLIVKSA